MPSAALYNLAKARHIPPERAEELWDKAKDIVSKEYGSREKIKGYWPLVMGITKKMMGMHEGITFKEFLTCEGKDEHAGLIARGICLNIELKDIKQAHAILDGTLSADGVLDMLPYAGTWWYLLGKDGATVEDAKSFAKKEGDLTSDWGREMMDELENGELAPVEFPVVLVAKAPQDWDPDDNPSRGLDGNSSIDAQKWKTVQLVRVMYFTSAGWVSKNCTKTIDL